MNIRNRLTLRFFLISAVIIAVGCIAIYIFSADYREDNFYNRLRSKADNTAKLLIEVDEIDVNLLRKIESDNPTSLPNEKIIVYDYANRVLFSTDYGKAIRVSKDLLDQIRLEGEVRYTQGDYEVLGFLFKGQYDRFAVVTAATDIYGFVKLKNLRTILLSVFGISIVIVSVSGWIFAGRALHPISKVISQVDNISITSLNLRVDEGNGQDEIAKLAQTFNKMLERLESAFAGQKNFISNASHELRNPLTAITGQLEVTLLNKRSNDEYVKVITSVLEDIKNLNSLSNRLLVLAQTSATETNQKLRPLRIDEMLWQTKEELETLKPEYNITISLDEGLDDESKLTVRGDEQLIRAALINVIENGCKYSPDRTTQVEVKSIPSGLTLVFKDRGIGIPKEEQESIFEPFYRATNTNNQGGYGIGLSMVKQIMRLHKGKIDLESALAQGTTVFLTFPIETH